MLKYSYEDENNELKIWVDPEDGSLNVRVGMENNSVKVPADTGREIVTIIKTKQAEFNERERAKMSYWTKLNNLIAGQKSDIVLMTNPYSD